MSASLVNLLSTLLLLVSSVPLIAAGSGNETCDKMLLETDKCIGRLTLITQKSVYIPRSADDLTNIYCRGVENEIPCFKRYGRKCLKGLPRQLFNIAFRKAIELYKRFCYTPKGQQEYLHHIKCMKPDHLQLIHKYMFVFTDYLEYINRNVSTNDIVPWVCCAYFRMSEEAERQLHKFCDSVTGPETTQFVMDLVKSFAYDIVDIGCGRFSSTNACKSNLPEAMKVYEELGDVSKVKSKEYSAVVPAVKLIKRMDEA